MKIEIQAEKWGNGMLFNLKLKWSLKQKIDKKLFLESDVSN